MILLEELLPHKVFTFNGRKKILTSYGSFLYEGLKPKFAQTQELIEQTSLLFSKPKNLQLKICGRGELLDILAINLNFIGGISFMPMDNDSALVSVLSRKADIGIVHTGIDSTEIIMKPLMVNSFKFSISKTLMKSKPKNESELIAKIKLLPCLLYKNQDPVTENLMKSWRFSIDDLKIHRPYPNYTTLARMIHNGLGWAILPSHIEIDENLNHIIPLSINSSLHKKFYLCYRKEISSAGWLKDLLVNIKSISMAND